MTKITVFSTVSLIVSTFFPGYLFAAVIPSCKDPTPNCEENITVTTSQATGYLTTPSDTPYDASALGLQSKEIPRSIETINHDVIRHRGDRSLADVVSQATGFSGVATPTLSNSFSVRGFMPVSWLYNGVEMPGSTLQLGDPSHYDSVEILRGPGSLLNGLSAVGGSVNLVSRKASFARQPVELDYSLASYRSQHLHVGSGGTLLDNIAAYRFDASGNDTGSNVDDERNKQQRVSGSLLLRVADNALLTLDVDRMLNNSQNAYFGTPLVNGHIDSRLRDINYNNLSDSRIKSNATSLQASLAWFLTPDVEIRNTLYSYNGFREWRNVERYRYISGNTASVIRDSWGDLSHDDHLLGNRTSLILDHPLGELDNRVVVGADISRHRFVYESNSFPGSESVAPFAPPSESFSQGSNILRTPVRNVTQNQVNLFAEDQLSLTENLKLVGGLRYNHLDMDWTFHNTDGDTHKARTYVFSVWSLGTVYDLTDNLSLYGSYSTGREPGSDLFFISSDQTQLQLTNARQWEVGAKSHFWHQKGDLTLALYDLRKDNLFVPDAQNPETLNAVGRQTSRGIELTMALRPTTRWELAGNIAYTHARYDKFSTGNPPVSLDGNHPAYIPDWTANLSVRYMPTEQLGFTTLWHYVGASYNDDANKHRMPSYATFDLSSDYQLTRAINVGLRVRNLTDKLYAYQRTYADQVLIAPPRTYEAFLQVKF